MATTVADVVKRFKDDVGRALSPRTIREVCDELGHAYCQRVLDPVTTVHTFLTQVLHGNVACSAVADLMGKSFSAAAYCSARARLPGQLFESLFDRVTHGIYGVEDAASRWLGHRVWLMDGSSFSMADLPELQEAFGQPGNQRPGCGFPVAHFLALFHAGVGFLQRVIPAPLRTHDMANAAALHPELQEGDILVADRGFASFVHLALLSQQKVHAVFRCHQRQIVNFRPGRQHKTSRNGPKGMPTSRWLKRLGKHDQLVEYVKPSQKPDWMDVNDFTALPETLNVRELRFTIRVPGRRTKTVTVVTTLLDPVRYAASAIAELYGMRWQIEVYQPECPSSAGLYQLAA